MSRPPAPRRVAIVAYEGVQPLDVVGPFEVFARASLIRWMVPQEHPGYAVEVLARRPGPVAGASGLRLLADRGLGTVRGGVDTLLVAGGEGSAAAMRDELLLAWLRRMAPRVRRLGSVCSGSLLLAEAGLLEGRRATTHWRVCELMAQRYPGVTVDPDPIYVRDGNVWTSAGVTAGMDLALAMVEDDLGRAVALSVAREMVMFLHRPGGQSQFSAQLAVQSADREPLRELVAWIGEHPQAGCSVPALAKRVAMSPRHFARVFRAQLGATPARFVERVRVEAARRRLEESDDGVDAVAAGCGFGTAESMRRAFLRTVRVAPATYRARFRSRRAS